MSKLSLSIILAIVTAFAAFGWYMVHLNAKLADDLLREKINRPVCTATPYTVGTRPTCILVRKS